MNVLNSHKAQNNTRACDAFAMDWALFDRYFIAAVKIGQI
jgi:hypothetical protein